MNLLLYIDPGTGSMLFTLIIGLVSAGVYGLRNLLIKLRFLVSGGRREADASRRAFAIFTDDKRYWNVFEPICREFERRGVELDYLTASPDDPALTTSYEHVNCEFIGEGNKAFARLNLLKADIVLATTPGLDVYQWKRSRDVRYYVHILHAISDACMYRMFGLDYYDAVLINGDFQREQVRELERLRKLPEKETPLVGLTFMDEVAKRLEQADPVPEHETTVLLAPSWGASAIFSLYGGKIIDALLETGYKVIVRPHPQSFKSETELMNELLAAYPDSDRLEWNRDNDNFEVLRRSDIMISDFSGVIFDFSLLFDKPVIYTEPEFDSAPYDACWLSDEPWTFKVLPEIGRELTMERIGDIKQLIDECLTDPTLKEGRDRAREQTWPFPGEAAKRTVDYLIEKRAELTEGQS